MAVVVIIQRVAKAGKQEEVFELVKQLRARAVLQPGYLSGETFFSPTNPTHLILSRWRSLKDWRAWESSPERREILAKMEPLLVAPAVTDVYLDSPSQIPL